ncbi:hypothetical protein [Roseovarius sp. EL26]|nr:hypothetical protein [Roseovarius sp. EL26]
MLDRLAFNDEQPSQSLPAQIVSVVLVPGSSLTSRSSILGPFE